MRYTVTALASDGSVIWSTEVACNSFDTAFRVGIRGYPMGAVHSILVARA